MLKRVAIENYRSCLRTVIDLHPNLSVLIGPNSSGKTNILQAIMLLQRLTGGGGFRQRGDAISVESRIKAVFEYSRTKVQLNATVDAYPDESNNDIITASREKWKFTSGNGSTASLQMPLAFAARPDFGGFSLPFRNERYYFPASVAKSLLRREEAPVWTVAGLKRVAHYCMGIRYYGASQFTNPGTCPASFQVEQERQRHTVFRARGHAKFLYQMYSASKATPNSNFGQFMDIVGPRGLRLIDSLTFREVPTSSVDYSVRVGGRIEVRKRHRLLIVPQFRIGSQKLSPNQLSEGTFKTLALLFHIVTEDSTALLIEEPEVCVHHGLLSSILELVKGASRRKQMILSTHSDYVLDHVKPENVYRVNFDKKLGTAVHHIPKAMNRRELLALREYLEREGNLGEYWRETGFGE